MRHCECGNTIPWKITIDGKRRNLKNRTKCFECSPFKSKRYIFGKEPGPLLTEEEKKEKNRQKHKTWYERKKKEYGGTNPVTEHRRRVKRKAIEYSGGKCIKCEYDSCNSSLAFHHVDPEQKEVELSDGRHRKWESAKKEIDKTILVCHNCHGEIHSNLWEPNKKIINKQEKLRKNYKDKPLVEYKLIRA